MSYASEDRKLAEDISASLGSIGHSVFFDKNDLPPGEEFHQRIRQAIEKSELLVFLVSQDSISKGSYTLTELKFAREKWPRPAGRVLPVLVRPVKDFSEIPSYLRSGVTVLQPEGNVAAEVVAEVERRSNKVKVYVKWLLFTLLVLLGIGIASWYLYPKINENEPDEITVSPRPTVVPPEITASRWRCTDEEKSRQINSVGFDKVDKDLNQFCHGWLHVNDDEFCDYCRVVKKSGTYELLCTMGEEEGLIGDNLSSPAGGFHQTYSDTCVLIDWNGNPVFKGVAGNYHEYLALTCVRSKGVGETQLRLKEFSSDYPSPCSEEFFH